MLIQDIQFIGSYPTWRDCPVDHKPEYAFIGRSNVGKSSLINMLLGQEGVARISNRPGKTQLLNYFLINKSWYIVDMPGYGYAKVSKKERKTFRQMVQDFLLHRRTLACTFVLADVNIGPQQIDLDFINWMGEMGLPFVVIRTKADRPNKGELATNQADFDAQLAEVWEELPRTILTSSKTAVGRDEVLQLIADTNALLAAQQPAL